MCVGSIQWLDLHKAVARNEIFEYEKVRGNAVED